MISGSSGLIGSALVAALERRGDRVSRLVRPSTAGEGIAWDPVAGSIDSEALEGVDAVVNLSGRGIGEKRWTRKEKRRLTESRLLPTRLLSETIAGLSQKPSVFLSASAIGIYGDRGDRELDETAAAGTGFLPNLTQEWEAATLPASASGVRVAHLRSGIVLTTSGGALGRMLAPFGPSWLSPFRWGLGGKVGKGRQVWSWISLEDQVQAIIHLLTSEIEGPVNLTSPAPVTNKDFTKALGSALRRPTVLPVPRFVLKIILGRELAQALVLTSARVLPEKLLHDGFEFAHNHVTDGLAAALG